MNLSHQKELLFELCDTHDSMNMGYPRIKSFHIKRAFALLVTEDYM